MQTQNKRTIRQNEKENLLVVSFAPSGGEMVGRNHTTPGTTKKRGTTTWRREVKCRSPLAHTFFCGRAETSAEFEKGGRPTAGSLGSLGFLGSSRKELEGDCVGWFPYIRACSTRRTHSKVSRR
jgi:hypothetical protein